MNSSSSPSLSQKKTWGGGGGVYFLDPVAFFLRGFREICTRSDLRQSSGQEGELLYAERASRGYQI